MRERRNNINFEVWSHVQFPLSESVLMTFSRLIRSRSSGFTLPRGKLDAEGRRKSQIKQSMTSVRWFVIVWLYPESECSVPNSSIPTCKLIKSEARRKWWIAYAKLANSLASIVERSCEPCSLRFWDREHRRRILKERPLRIGFRLQRAR